MENESSSHFDEKPWTKKIEQFGPIAIWEVDGAWIRKHLNKEFNNWAQGRDPRFSRIMPQDEFWIDTGYDPTELQYFIDNMLMQRHLLMQGYSRPYAEREGTRIEDRERHRNGEKITERMLLEGKPELRKLYDTSSLEVWLVDGKMVRGHDPRFCSGGHDLVYDYVPDGHAWVDNALVPKERPLAAVHEVKERNGMELGEKYSVMHPKCSRLEWQCRWDPQELLRQQKELGMISAGMF